MNGYRTYIATEEFSPMESSVLAAMWHEVVASSLVNEIPQFGSYFVGEQLLRAEGACKQHGSL